MKGPILESVGGLPKWCPSPKPTRFSEECDLSTSDECMKTPESVSYCLPPTPDRIPARTTQAVVAGSASPDLCGIEEDSSKMKRTPQPNLTQSKLTSLLQARGAPEQGAPQATAPGTDAPRVVSLETIEMDTSGTPELPTGSDPARPPGSAMVTTDFLLKALKDNTDLLIRSFNSSIGALSTRIDDNAAKIAANSESISRQETTAASQQIQLKEVADRVLALERSGRRPEYNQVEGRATLSTEYLTARRSVRLWPVEGHNDDELWEGVGEFLHGTLAINETDVCQEDIETITRVIGGNGHTEKNEVMVRNFDKLKRDLVVSSSPNLAKEVDRDGKPTAGIRFEIPSELTDTFRLLHRFGTRLRARHGVGTKRHIKFDDFCGSLYANIKLPGDSSWTRVTPDMAREDLCASMREENEHTQKRLAAKLVPGPRERLGRPVGDSRALHPMRGIAERPAPQTMTESSGLGPSGKRPRWSVPDRRRPL